MSDATRAEVCAVAIAEAFRGDGEILASFFGTTPAVGGRLARLTFEPDLVMTDGIATAVETTPPVSGKPGEETVYGSWLPFRTIFDVVWSGRDHVLARGLQEGARLIVSDVAAAVEGMKVRVSNEENLPETATQKRPSTGLRAGGDTE